MFESGKTLSLLAYLKRVTDWGLRAERPAVGGNEGLGAKPTATGRFVVIFEKYSFFNAIKLDFARFYSKFKKH